MRALYKAKAYRDEWIEKHDGRKFDVPSAFLKRTSRLKIQLFGFSEQLSQALWRVTSVVPAFEFLNDLKA